MASHPTLNYFAAGYDNGMCVFKIERERQASVRVGSAVFYVRQKSLYFYDLQQKQRTMLSPITTNGKAVLSNQPSSIYHNAFNQASHDVILNFEQEGG